jgi:hypothetical protein
MAEHKPDNFNWNDEAEIVVKRRDAIAVYQNGSGGVTIRMEASALEDEDHVIWFPIEDAQAVIDGILRVKKQIEAGPAT